MKEYAKLFRALSNETRLTVMVILNQKELCVCQIEKFLKLSQAKVSRHLTVLKYAGLVKDRREGLWIYYSAVKQEGKVGKAVFDILHMLADSETKFKMNALKIKACRNIKNKKIC